MLKEERVKKILEQVNKSGSTTVNSLVSILKSSESTIRRDLTELDHKKLLKKVHGGAISINKIINTDTIRDFRDFENPEDKIKIAKFAQALIKENMTVFIDAGSTTAALIKEDINKNAKYVTNDISIAKNLLLKGYDVYIPAGKLKYPTMSIIGESCIESLKSFYFDIGFFGTNAYDYKFGYTTPDISEAECKKCAIRQSKKAYVLADSSKESLVSNVKFANFSDAILINEKGIN